MSGRRLGVVVWLMTALATAPAAAQPGPPAPPADPPAIQPVPPPPDPAGTDAGVATAAPDSGAIVIPPDIMDSPDAPQARAAVSTSSVQVGATFTLFVTITYAAGAEVNIPSALDFGGAFEEVRRTRGDRTSADGRRVREFELELMGWFVGDQMVPPIPVTYVIGGAAHSTQTNAVPVTVVGVIGDGEAALRDIAPPVPVSRPDWTIIWISIVVGASVAGAALILVAAFLLRRRRRTRAPVRKGVRVGPPLEADAEALARLDELEASGTLDADDRKPAFIELSEIVRVYLGRRFGFPALDSTTSEIKASLRRRPGTAAALEILEEWLRVSDLVKYAGYQPPLEEAREAVAQARELVAVTPAAIATQLEAVAPAPAAPPTPAQPAPSSFGAPPAEEVIAAATDDDEAEPKASDTLRGIVAVSDSAAEPRGGADA